MITPMDTRVIAVHFTVAQAKVVLNLIRSEKWRVEGELDAAALKAQAKGGDSRPKHLVADREYYTHLGNTLFGAIPRDEE